jgi:hypothetical protein
VLSVALALAALAALVVLDPLELGGYGELAEALSERGRVAVAGDGELRSLQAPGTALIDVATLPAVRRALSGQDAGALTSAMREADVDAVLVAAAPLAEGDSLRARIARYDHVPGLRGLHLSPAAAVYAPALASELEPVHRRALAHVARGVVGGARPPRVTSFPEPLRRLRPVEVMVLLRQGPRPRLWRSARGNSIARALLTASTVARKRWFEREQAMGGGLDARLPQLAVEVSLLSDDGTVGDRDPVFIDRVFRPEHGVAYERKGAWRYLLPDDTREAGQGRASVAYRELFAEDGLSPEAMASPEVRLYRLVVEPLAESPPVPAPSDGLSDVGEPDEVLDDAQPAAD